ncbi:MAG TPA: hypothetical protein GXX31_02860 [Methanothermobacter sp.]|uniref:hypothetical protein n=1 Tax=Methanothermobacter tenebrarum TaxID=680118 RepID=UPI0018282461|nr:hypothetical protein [Methanothermobacter tenebrarum]MDD3454408.1 hypothetical protein [Methanobacteriales archaeon]MDI6882455.1 hypothetical protein [Methanothermobacter sp.]MDX9693832.1 hypothetical protein [Methanothermobacter sp.]HHW16308.1 hypothetical protein [Methanothermobacter sp.]
MKRIIKLAKAYEKPKRDNFPPQRHYVNLRLKDLHGRRSSFRQNFFAFTCSPTRLKEQVDNL